MARKAYTQEFKDQAAGLVVREGRSVKDVAQSLGVDQSSLRHWVRMARAAGMRGVRPDAAVVGATDPARRVRDLEAQVRRLEMERDILKKAAAYFARDSAEGRP
ncbi:MAG: transposase [Phycisphaerales bacterium]